MKKFFLLSAAIVIILTNTISKAKSLVLDFDQNPTAVVALKPEPSTAQNEIKPDLVDNNDVVTEQANPELPDQKPSAQYSFGNPAGCSNSAPVDTTPQAMLAKVQAELGTSVNLEERRQNYIWNGTLGTMLNVSQDQYVFEFEFNSFKPPLTYRGDHVATVFLANGFVVWFRGYGGKFRLLAIPMTPGVDASPWAEYVNAYWGDNSMLHDEKIIPVMKKLPCHWLIDQGYVSDEKIREMFILDWNIPDYLADGRQYLASTCKEANRISREKIGFWDASSMCGPLAWTIMKDVNGFPYRMGSWYANADAFTSANPKWNGQPWGSFDPETFDLTHTDSSMPGYDFAKKGNLYPGDVIYSYTSLYKSENDQHFDHIFLVAGIGKNQERVSISNMVRNYPYADCSINEVVLYTPGDRETGVINHEWNGFGFGQTGQSGFDVFRWKWISYHLDGQSIQYVVRWGDTLETIAFDWKVSPESIAAANHFLPDTQLEPGQMISLPVPDSSGEEIANP
jgi:hypothetical protein